MSQHISKDQVPISAYFYGVPYPSIEKWIHEYKMIESMLKP